MRIIDLHLQGVGPFKTEHLTFIDKNDDLEKPPIVIITGENGTGKTIVLDAIRGLMFGGYDSVGRDIFNGKDIDLYFNVNFKENLQKVSFSKFTTTKNPRRFGVKPSVLSEVFYQNLEGTDWVTAYWNGTSSSNSFEIKSLAKPRTDNYMKGSLSGKIDNASVTELIVFMDYLRNSMSKGEAEIGSFMYDFIQQIFKLCLNEGDLAFVSRVDLMPMVKQRWNKEVSIDKLSSGNLYLMRHFIDLLSKMYAVNRLKNKPIEEVCNTRGLLLIDEAENQLHPKWQKTLIKNIQTIFPNLQIILTTHSPFIVASAEDAKIFVCEPNVDHCVIKDETAEYSNKPIEEILMSPLFGYTQVFNEEITKLLEERKKAIQTKDFTKRKQIEKQLQNINPQYFAYFDIDEMLSEISPELTLTK